MDLIVLTIRFFFFYRKNWQSTHTLKQNNCTCTFWHNLKCLLYKGESIQYSQNGRHIFLYVFIRFFYINSQLCRIISMVILESLRFSPFWMDGIGFLKNVPFFLTLVDLYTIYRFDRLPFKFYRYLSVLSKGGLGSPSDKLQNNGKTHWRAPWNKISTA